MSAEVHPESQSQGAVGSIRVPREDGAILAVPTLGNVPPQSGPSMDDVPFGSASLGELRHRAIREVLACAIEHTAGVAGEDIPSPATNRIVATGHQPGPFHPGVWIKNVVVDALARRRGAVGLSVVVDNDLRASSSVRIPVGDRDWPRVESIPFDGPQPAGPWEEAKIVDPAVWASFPERLVAALAGWGIEPCVAAHWRAETGSMSAALTGVRVRAERAAGITNLEVPLSRIEETDAFRRFTLHLLREADRFQSIHEDVLTDYRRRHGLRSRTHPVPSLEMHERGIEAPLWTWRAGETRRRRVFVRQRAEWLRLSDGEEDFAVLPATDEAALGELRTLAESGLRLRSRALTTTMFLRLFVADLFVHGVGGAKYDELTDRIVERFVGVAPPPFLLLSATRHLPLGGLHDVRDDELPRLEHRLRDLRHNPDRHLPNPDFTMNRLIAEKRVLVHRQNESERGGTRRERRARTPMNRRRYEALRAVNEELARHAEPLREELAARIDELHGQRAANEILGNREWAWWLHPANQLVPWMREAITPNENR